MGWLLVGWLLDRFRERDLFLTHGGTWEIGSTWRWRDDEQTYRITRLVPTSRTRLLGGDSAPCWRVRGVPSTPPKASTLNAILWAIVLVVVLLVKAVW